MKTVSELIVKCIEVTTLPLSSCERQKSLFRDAGTLPPVSWSNLYFTSARQQVASSPFHPAVPALVNTDAGFQNQSALNLWCCSPWTSSPTDCKKCHN